MPRKKKSIAGDPDEIIAPKVKISHGRFWQLGLVVVAGFFILSSLLLFNRCQTIKAEADNLKKAISSSDVRQAENEKLLKEIGAKTLLPAGRPLTIFLASPEQIALWPSLGNAKIGDWLLLYPDGLVVWRPASGQIVLSDTAQGLFAGSPKIEGISLGIRNGSPAKGGAASLADSFAGDPKFKIVEISNAATTTYAGNWLINLSGQGIPAELAAKFPGNTTTTLPANEASTTANFLLIIGGK